MKVIANEIEGTEMIIHNSLTVKEAVKYVNKKTVTRDWYVFDYGLNFYKIRINLNENKPRRKRKPKTKV